MFRKVYYLSNLQDKEFEKGKINMVYRKIVYTGEGERALRKRIEEITQRKEKIFHFTIETFEDDKIS